MSGSDYSLNMAINASNNAGGVISNFISSLGPVGGAVAVVGAAVVGIGIASVKMAGDFQQSMTTLVTGAGESQKNIAMVGDGIKKMAVDTGTSTNKLIEAMFTAESAGYHGAQGLQVLQAAAQGARVGHANLASMTDVLTTSLHNYGLQSSQAVPVVNSFISTVANGKMVMDDLNQSLTGVLPTASKAGVKLTDVEGALATMAASGDKGASAGTHLSQMFQSLQNPAAAATKVLKSIGLTTQGISDDMKKSFPDTIQTIYDALAKKFPVGSAAFNAAAAKIVGGNKQVKAWNELTGNSFKDLVANTKNIAGAYKNSGSAVTGFSLVQQNFNFKMDQAHQAISTLLITIGQKLLPVFSNLASQIIPIIANVGNWLVKSGALDIAAQGLTNGISFLITTISKMISIGAGVTSFFQHNQVAMDILIGVVAGLTAGFIAWGVSVAISFIPVLILMGQLLFTFIIPSLIATAVATFAAAAPFIIVGLIVAAVVIGIVLAIQHWGAIMDWISGKAEQMRIKNEQAHVKMRIAADTHTAEQATRVIANLDRERAGVLQKLRETHDPAERMELEHQLKMLDIQRTAQEKRLQQVEKDKAAQIAKQKQLHDDLIESQKNFFQRFLDMIGSWTGDQMSKLGTMVHGWVDWLGNLKNLAIEKITGLLVQFIGYVIELKIQALNHIKAMKEEFLNHVQELKDQAINKVSSLVNGIETYFTSLPGKALQWGEDMLQGFITGITSKIGDLTSTISNVAGSVAKFLHFTKPDEGPLATVDEWMPHMGDTLIEGLNKISPKLQAAALRAAMSVSSPFSAGNTGSPGHIFDFIGSNYSGYNQGMATTRKRTASETKQLEKLEATLEKNIDAYEHPKPIKWDKTAKGRAHQEAAFEKAQAKREAALEKEEANIQKLENHYHITVNHTGKGKWTKQDADELAKLIADQARLQSKHPQTASGRRN